MNAQTVASIDGQLHQEHHLIDRLCDDLYETLKDRNAEAATRLLRQLRELVTAHFDAEERDWFPALAARSSRMRARAEELQSEHAPLRHMLEQIDADVRNGIGPQCLHLCERLLRTLRGHAQKEELLLFSDADSEPYYEIEDSAGC